MKASSVVLMMLDLIIYSHAGGGLDNIVTILSDLVEQIQPQKLAKTSSAFEGSTVRRLGYLLDRFAKRNVTCCLSNVISKSSASLWVELEPALESDAHFTMAPIEDDERWEVVIRGKPRPN